MKPRLTLTLFAAVLLCVLSLLAGNNVLAKGPARDPSIPLSPAGLDRAGADGAGSNLTISSPLLAHTVYLPALRKLGAKGCRERGCKLVVENAGFLDRESLGYASRRYLPGVVLVGGERLGQQIARSAAYPGRIVGWASV